MKAQTEAPAWDFIDGITGATEPKAVPEDRPQDLRRLEALERWAIRKVRSDLKGALRRAEEKKEGEDRARETDSVLASHSERVSRVVDRVSSLESRTGAHLARIIEAEKLGLRRIEIEAERREELRAELDGMEAKYIGLLERVGDLTEALTAQGRQLEELLLWRESVMETADIVADENAMGAIAEAESDANEVLPGDAEGGDQ
ncbi:hypothetical protein [Actinocorallia libanotica]